MSEWKQIDIEELINEKTGEITLERKAPKFVTHFTRTKVDAETITGDHMTDDTSFVPLDRVVKMCDRQTLIAEYEKALAKDEDDEEIDYSAENGYDLADIPAIAEYENLKTTSEIQNSTTQSVSDKAESSGEASGSSQHSESAENIQHKAE